MSKGKVAVPEVAVVSYPDIPSAIVNRSTRYGEPGYSWPELAAAGHCFPQRCPDWSGFQLVGQRAHVMAPAAMPVFVVVCSCGVFQTVPAANFIPLQ